MKDLLKIDIKVILIVILIVIILFMRDCSSKGITLNSDGKPVQTIKVDGKPYEVIKHTSDTQYITKYTTIYKKGDDITHDSTIYVPIPVNVDTLKILKDTLLNHRQIRQ